MLWYLPHMVAPPVSGFAAPPRPEMRAASVLVADDDRDTVLTLVSLLREEGYEVRGVHSGPEALKAARDARPDAAILDIEMPGMSGYAVARDIRDVYQYDRPPLLIAISGKWTQSSDRLLGGLVGFDHYFIKPCDPQVILKLLAPIRS